MARIRTIKPETFDDPDLCELEPIARWLFIGLWAQADRRGRLEDDPRRIKARVLPFDDVDINALLDVLVSGRFLVRYNVNGENYLWVRNFEKHQRPHPREAESVLPSPPLDGQKGRRGRVKDMPSRVKVVPGREKELSSKPGSSGSSGSSDSGKEVPTTSVVASTATLKIGELAEMWNQTAEQAHLPTCNELNMKRRVATLARLHEHPTRAYWQDIIRRIATSPFCLGENDRGWRANFEWLVRPDTHLRVLEGRYEDTTPAGRKPNIARELQGEDWQATCRHEPPCTSRTMHRIALATEVKLQTGCEHDPPCLSVEEHQQRAKEG